MKIIRDNKEIELTYQELYEAHKEFIVLYMQGELESSFDIPEADSIKVAEKAYVIYSDGDDLSQYESMQKAADEYNAANEIREKGEAIIKIYVEMEEELC